MKALKMFRRKSRHCMEAGTAKAQGEEQTPGLTTGLKVLILMLQVIGALLQLWRR